MEQHFDSCGWNPTQCEGGREKQDFRSSEGHNHNIVYPLQEPCGNLYRVNHAYKCSILAIRALRMDLSLAVRAAMTQHMVMWQTVKCVSASQSFSLLWADPWSGAWKREQLIKATTGAGIAM